MNPPASSQRIVPYLYYDEPRAALEHLCRVFGFEQTMLLEWPNGKLAHAEASLGGERVLIGAADARFGLISPVGLNGVHAVICVYVDGIDAHHAHAQSCGAEIAQPLADVFYGARAYSARDPEGNLWTFREHRRDPSHQELIDALSQLYAAQQGAQQEAQVGGE